MKYKINKCPIVLLKSIFENFDIYGRSTDGCFGQKVLKWRPRIGMRCLDFHQRDERVWLKPRVCDGYNPLPTKVIGRLQVRAMSNNGGSTGAMMMMM